MKSSPKQSAFIRENQAATGLVELEAIYQTAPVGLCVLDTELRFVRINERMAELNGVAAADHLGRTVREIVPHLADQAEPLLRRVLDTGEPALGLEISGETAARQGATRTWIEYWFPLKDAHDQVIGINIVAEEITERKKAEQALQESEERFFTALRHSPVVFAHVDPALRYEWIFNPHPDFDPTGVVGKRDDELSKGPGIDAMVRLKQRVLDEGIQQREQIAFTRSDGIRWYDVTATPVLDKDGKTKRIVTASIDITDQKKAEDALHELTETLADHVAVRTRQVQELASALMLAEQAERQRVAQILHDGLQQQLYAVQLPLKMLERKLQKARQSAWHESTLEVAHHIEEAIETARHLMVELSPPVLKGEGLREALLWLAAQMKERFGLHIELHGATGLSLPADNMRGLLFQIVRELLFNVVKHTRTNKVRVSLIEDGTYLTIEIADEGAGIDADTMNSRLNATKEAFEVYHARERLGLFGGHMEVTSQPHDGTRITIQVPLESL